MVKIQIVYEGDLHCRLTHGPSGKEIVTDAPKDNMGKGESFSPTDLVASALGSCMLTIMGIFAQKHGINIQGAQVAVTKEMVKEPERKIGRITLIFKMVRGLSSEQRSLLEKAAYTCPVHKSLSREVETPITFEYPD